MALRRLRMEALLPLTAGRALQLVVKIELVQMDNKNIIIKKNGLY
jgi:hypothetical protein